ncbi:MAG: universal stress protein [Rhodospirillaceae bacterium]
MSIRTMLVPVRGDGKGEGVLDHALALGRPFNVHIYVVHCRARAEDLLPYSTVMTSGMRSSILEAAVKAAEEEEARVRGLFMEYLAGHEIQLIEEPPAPDGVVTASWHEIQGKQAHVVAVRGRLADVIAVARPESGGLGHATFEAALLETGKLVLLCPPEPVGTIGRHVCLAWNGSAESARAASAVLPLLECAEKVTLFTAPENLQDELTVDDLINHLGWHGVEGIVRHLDVSAHDIGGALLDNTKAAGGDVLVMGGYGHSRRRELVMGGVTRFIAENTDVPVLMTH